MKNRFFTLWSLVVMMIFVFTNVSNAQGLLGKRYVAVQVGQMNPGDDDVEDVDDSIFLLGGRFNTPVNPNVDAFFDLAYSKLEGDIGSIDVESTAKEIIVGMNYYFSPNEDVNPFLSAAAGIVWTEVEVDGYGDEDEDDFAFSIGGGAEVELNQQASIVPELSYVNVDDEDDVIAGVTLNYWFDESVFGNLGLGYGFDDGDITTFIGLGYGF